MQITITEREIHAALRKYIIARLRLSATEEIKVDLMATRGIDGFKAMLDIIEPEDMETGALEPPPAGELTRGVAPSAPAQIPAPTVKTSVPAVPEPVKEVPTTDTAVVKSTGEDVERSVPFDVPVTPVAPKVSGLFAHLATS